MFTVLGMLFDCHSCNQIDTQMVFLSIIYSGKCTKCFEFAGIKTFNVLTV